MHHSIDPKSIVNAKQALISVFNDTIRFLRLPENDFSWSSWNDADEAITEINAIMETINLGQALPDASVLFAATGPVQEVAVSSGWGEQFLKLASQFDEAFAVYNQIMNIS